MKKLISLVVVLILLMVGLLAGATYWFGLEAEKHYHAMLKQASQASAQMQFVNESYERGFWRSTARTVLEIHAPAGQNAPDPGPLRILLVQELRHGPLVFNESLDGAWQLKPVLVLIRTQAEPGPELKSTLRELFGALPDTISLKDQTVIYYGGGGASHIAIPAFREMLPSSDPMTVSSEGLTAHLEFSPKFKRFSGYARLPGLEVAGQGIAFKVKSGHMEFDGYEGVGGITLGNATLHMDGLAVEPGTQDSASPFLVKAFDMKSSTQETGDTVSSTLWMRLEQLVANGTPYGPAVFDLELRKLDAASLVKLQKMMQEIQRQAATDPSRPDMSQIMLGKVAEVLPGLLAKSPEVELKELSLKTGDGEFLGRAKVAVNGGTNPAALQNPFMLLGALSAEAECSASAPLVENFVETLVREEIDESKEEGLPEKTEELEALIAVRTNERLEALIAQNLIMAANGTYKASTTYRAGQLILNGQTIPLQEFLR